MNTNGIVIHGIEERGIWKQAHQITHGYGLDRFEDITPQDAYNDIVVALIELTVENPDIVTKGPAYLLISAANRVRNRYAQLYHTYFVKQGMTTASLDALADDNDHNDHDDDRSEFIAQLAVTVDYELMATVRSIVAGLDAESRQVAGYLYDGYKAADIARLTGMYPMQVSRVVKGLRTQLEGALL